MTVKIKANRMMPESPNLTVFILLISPILSLSGLVQICVLAWNLSEKYLVLVWTGGRIVVEGTIYIHN